MLYYLFIVFQDGDTTHLTHEHFLRKFSTCNFILI